MIGLFREAWDLQAFLAAHAFPFCFIGGVALQHWGEPRVTRDLGLTLFTGFGGEAPVVDALLAQFLIATPAGVAVDIALGALPFESEMIARAREIEFEPGVALRICTAEDLMVLKAFADRLQDRADIASIARRRGRELDWDAVVERLAPLIEAKGEPAILDDVLALRTEFAG